MQRHIVKNIKDLLQIVSSNGNDPAHITLEDGVSGVWLSDELWNALKNGEGSGLGASSLSLEKAVSLLIKESEKLEQNQQAVARSEEQFERVFSMSQTPMRIEDWTEAHNYLATLAKRYSPVEIKEYLSEAPEEVKNILQSIKIISCNDAFRETIDAQHDHQYSGSLDKIIPPDNYPKFVNVLLEMNQGKKEIQENLKLRRIDGGLRDVQMHLSLYSEYDSNETKMLVSYWDITQQKRLTRNLQSIEDFNAEERHRSMLALNSIREGVITTDQNGNVINLNPTAKRITGWEQDYFQRSIEEVFSPCCDHFPSIKDMLEVCKTRSITLDGDTVSMFTNKKLEEYWLTFSVTPIISDELISGFIIIFHDVSESKHLLEQIKEHKNLDPITHLLNRQAFKGKLMATIKQCKTVESEHALLLIDLDQFHVVNDTCGHSAGDKLLGEIAELIRSMVRSDDVVARIGGDEFGVLLNGCGGEVALRIAQNIMENIKEYKFSYDGNMFKLGASIGIVVVDQTKESVDKLLVDADSVVQVAKDNGSNQVLLYDEEQEILLKKQDELRWFTRITHALENDLFVLSYQKIAPISTDSGSHDIHYEILLRMLSEEGELISPSEFMPAAERYNLMPQIDRWVVKHAFQWVEINLHRSQSIALFSINLSGHSIGEDSFISFVAECFEDHHVPGDRICFEITETMAINNMKNTLNFMERFKKIGCKFSLDDFGTGFSSYGYLKTLPVDFLKIDGSFVSKIAKDPIDLAMVRSINEVGHIMNRKTIAEYVEDEDIMALLREIGVDYAQGYGVEAPQLLDSNGGWKGKTGT